ncbi:MAG: MerR family transcriptional regulator [Egibacteraceae bacterium]|jgi:DNA-binding transcriptional MerR regulator
MTHGPGSYTIGELAALCGMPVKTIRFYSDEGVLPPAGRTAAGYRLYSDTDGARLELIRTLREVGFGLPTIRALLDRDLPVQEAIDLQLRAVDLQLRTLRAARGVLRRARQRGATDAGYLARLQRLARLTAREREQLIGDFWADAAGDAPVDREWLEGMAAASVPDLPDDPTDAQLDAWLELGELASDDDFKASLRKMSSSSFWDEAADTGFDLAAWRAANDEVIADVVAAVEQGVAPGDRAARALLDRFVALHAAARNRQPDAALRADQLRDFDEHDPRASRWWELVAVLRGWPSPAPTIGAYAWLREALRARVASEGPAPRGTGAQGRIH